MFVLLYFVEVKSALWKEALLCPFSYLCTYKKKRPHVPVEALCGLFIVKLNVNPFTVRTNWQCRLGNWSNIAEVELRLA